MTRKSKDRLFRNQQQNQNQTLQTMLVDGLKETKALNAQLIKQFTDESVPFYDSLRFVDVRLGQIEILFIANGGEETAAAMRACSDNLDLAVSRFREAVQVIAKNPFSDIRYGEINQLVQYCGACKLAVDNYVDAKQTERPAIKKRVKEAIAQSQQFIADLFKEHTHEASELRLVATMLIDRTKSMSYGEALANIAETDPTTYRKFFDQDSKSKKLAYARQLVHRCKSGEL